MTILIVEDEPEARETLRDAFSDHGWTVAAAANGAQALALIAIEIPMVIVLDLVMPVMTGNELYEILQRDPRYARVPVVITTSDPSRAPDGVLVMRKPLNLERLMDTARLLARTT